QYQQNRIRHAQPLGSQSQDRHGDQHRQDQLDLVHGPPACEDRRMLSTGDEPRRLVVTRRRFLRASVALAAVAGAALLEACGGAPSPPPAATSAPQAAASVATPAGGLRKVRYGTTGAGFNPFIAMDQGYFAEQGIE